MSSGYSCSWLLWSTLALRNPCMVPNIGIPMWGPLWQWPPGSISLGFDISDSILTLINFTNIKLTFLILLRSFRVTLRKQPSHPLCARWDTLGQIQNTEVTSKDKVAEALEQAPPFLSQHYLFHSPGGMPTGPSRITACTKAGIAVAVVVKIHIPKTKDSQVLRVIYHVTIWEQWRASLESRRKKSEREDRQQTLDW